ncbi:hypothetical protein [Paenibacillus phytorum]|uniref:hypothetical protein n=1 Tax=Paenibacillus phytorum TaxID=2654977 RepID=UPI001492C05D|nr:hypothetical protein [Paenibacillus phytorum]
MNKEDISALIQKELEEHPQSTNLEIAQKYRVPLHIVQLFRNKLQKNELEIGER